MSGVRENKVTCNISACVPMFSARQVGRPQP
uniref:Uncharacterized protein n=1 Tax=Anguilla anguilla TaxID=7936 RepID=A0A0E9S532_ANGAN